MLVYRLEPLFPKPNAGGAVGSGLLSTYDFGLRSREYLGYPDKPCHLAKSAYNHRGPVDESPTFLKRFRNLQKKWGAQDVIFGCSSLEQLFAIIPSRRGRRAMMDKGGVISVYRTDGRTTATGLDQVVFLKSRSLLVDLIGLDELDNCG